MDDSSCRGKMGLVPTGETGNVLVVQVHEFAILARPAGLPRVLWGPFIKFSGSNAVGLDSFQGVIVRQNHIYGLIRCFC